MTLPGPSATDAGRPYRLPMATTSPDPLEHGAKTLPDVVQEPRPGPFNAEFDDDPERYDEMRAGGHMARRRTAFFQDVISEVPGCVLELGSGTGTLLRALAATHPDRELIGVEPLEGYAAFANARAEADGLDNVHVEVGVGEDLPACVETASVGLVMSIDALHHVRDLDAVVAEVTRAARPGARWVAMEPNRLHPYVLAYHVLTDGERTFPPAPFLRAVRRAGWSLKRRKRLFTFPSTTQQVPAWAAAAERATEWFPPVSGAIVLDLVKG